MLAFLQAPNNHIMTLISKIDLFCEIGMCTKRSVWISRQLSSQFWEQFSTCLGLKKMYVEIHEMLIFAKKLFVDSNLKKVSQPILVQL